MSDPESMKIAIETAAAKRLDEPATELAEIARLGGAEIMARFPGATP